jgi:N-acetylglucosaminyldiphosphoundecaprenol N-acetyl-beta-D-mannosaminyltransferase
VPDGAGLVWAASYVGEPVAEKVAGIDLMHELLAIGEVKGWRIFLLGASPEIIQLTADKLKSRYPQLQLAGVRDGYFKTDENEAVVNQIRESAADILLVGRSADKQEPWIDRYKDELGVPVMMGIGGSFDVLSGKLKRAPRIFIRLRLEWFYRLLQEPWRYRRMLLLPKFVVKVIRDKGKP